MCIYIFKLPWFRFKKKVMCMHAHLHMGICMPVQVPMEGAGQGHQICWSNRQLWAPWCGYWEPNSCPLWEQYTVLTTEPSFQLLAFGYLVCSQLPHFQGIVFWLAPLEHGRSKKWGPVDGLSGAIFEEKHRTLGPSLFLCFLTPKCFVSLFYSPILWSIV